MKLKFVAPGLGVLVMCVVVCLLIINSVGYAETNNLDAVHENIFSVQQTGTFPSPPEGFDPLSASDWELDYYGFPQRGTEGWNEAMVHSKQKIDPKPVKLGTRISHPPILTDSK